MHNWPHVKTTPQAGGIIFRHRPGSVEILLVSPKNGEAEWIFPKGHLKPRETPARAALRESCEEAGVLGFVVASAGAPLRFMSGSEPVSVDYFVIEAIGETTPTDARRRQWFSVPEARDAVTHADAKTLLAHALPAIEAHLAAQHRPLRDEAFESFLIAEYEHIGESLLRNEADGEKRVQTDAGRSRNDGAANADEDRAEHARETIERRRTARDAARHPHDRRPRELVENELRVRNA